jgi:CBS domain-containing protein
MNVSELMTKKLISVQPATSLADAARIMLDQHVSGLPVVDALGKLVGVVTEGDLLRRAEIGTAGKPAGWLKTFFLPDSLAADYVKTHGRHVSEVMTAEPITVTPQTALADAAALMVSKHIKRLPVVSEGALVGVVSRTDLLRVLALKLIEIQACKPSDVEIAEHIKTSLEHENWTPKAGIHIEVKSGVVYLKGIIMSDAEKQAVNVIAENAPGVKEVVDELVFVDPATGMAFQ